MSNKALAIIGSFNANGSNPVWDAEKGRLTGSTAFLASQVGLDLAAVEAHRDTMPTTVKDGKTVKPSLAKACKELVLANGGDEKQIRSIYKAYDQHRDQSLTDQAKINGMLAADPTVRKSLRASFNKKGEVIGAVTTYRRERSTKSKDVQIQNLQAQIAQLTAANAVAITA